MAHIKQIPGISVDCLAPPYIQPTLLVLCPTRAFTRFKIRVHSVRIKSVKRQMIENPQPAQKRNLKIAITLTRILMSSRNSMSKVNVKPSSDRVRITNATLLKGFRFYNHKWSGIIHAPMSKGYRYVYCQAENTTDSQLNDNPSFVIFTTVFEELSQE